MTFQFTILWLESFEFIFRIHDFQLLIFPCQAFVQQLTVPCLLWSSGIAVICCLAFPQLCIEANRHFSVAATLCADCRSVACARAQQQSLLMNVALWNRPQEFASKLVPSLAHNLVPQKRVQPVPHNAYLCLFQLVLL